MSAAAHGRDATRPIHFYPPAHPVVGSAWHAAVSCAAGSGGGREQQRRGLAGRGSQQQQQPARTSVQWVPVPSIGQLCQAAEGRGTQCLARPPGGTGSSGAQGPWSEYTAKPQLAAPKGGYGPEYTYYLRGDPLKRAPGDQHRTAPNARPTVPWPMELGSGVSWDNLSATFMPRLCVYGR